MISNVLLLNTPQAGASPSPIPLYAPTLQLAEQESQAHAPSAKAATAAAEAARFQAEAAKAPLAPQLALEAQIGYQTHVPQVDLIPGRGPLEFGTHKSYSIGPTLSYILFDGGKTRHSAKSARLQAEARFQESLSHIKQVKYATRLAYFRIQFTSANLISTVGSLKLAHSQDTDIGQRLRSGFASRLDKIAAERESLSYLLQFQKAQSDLAESIRSLQSLMGDRTTFDLRHPFPQGSDEPLPLGIPPATVLVSLQDLNKTLDEFTQNQKPRQISPELPELKSLDLLSQSAYSLAESHKSAAWPRISLGIRSVLSYPDAVMPRQIQNHLFSAALSWPLFERGLNRSLSQQHFSLAQSLLFQKEQKQKDLDRDLQILQDTIETLRSRSRIAKENSQKAENFARLIYDSFRSGHGRYLDVQTANQRLLEARFQHSQIQYQLLIHLADLDLLETPGESP